MALQIFTNAVEKLFFLGGDRNWLYQASSTQRLLAIAHDSLEAKTVNVGDECDFNLDDLHKAKADRAGTLAAYEESLAIRRRLAQSRYLSFGEWNPMGEGWTIHRRF